MPKWPTFFSKHNSLFCMRLGLIAETAVVVKSQSLNLDERVQTIQLSGPKSSLRRPRVMLEAAHLFV
jgi:hypothetical protein